MINFFKNFKKKKKKGFGALELLVAIAIFSLIVALALSWVTSNKAKGRDSKRTGELNALRDALQLYYTDHGHYPTSTANEERWCHIEAKPEDEAEGYNYCEGLYSSGDFVLDPYIEEVGDPRFKQEAPSGKTWSYRYISTSSGMGYKLHTDLETKDEYEIVSGGWYAGDVTPPTPPPPPPPPGNSVYFSMSNFETTEGENTAEITVNLSSPSSRVIRVNYRIKPGGDATEGSDFRLTGPGILIFVPGDTEESFSVRIIDDEITELSETVIFELYNPVNIEIGSPEETTLTIKDNDFWVKGYGIDGWSNAYSITTSRDRREYIVAARMRGFTSGNALTLTKVDLNGNPIWIKYLTSPSNTDIYPEPKIIRDSRRDEYIVTANYSANALIAKIDSDGNQVWSKRYSNVNFTDVANSGWGYVVTGKYLGNPIVAKFDRDGDLDWVKSYNISGNFNSIREDGRDYIIGGKNSGKALILKTDDDGEVDWARTFGDASTEIQAVRDIWGGYIVSGQTTAYSAIDELGFVAELDNYGRTEWFKTYGLEESSYDWLDIERTSDGGYIVSGKFDPFDGICNGTLLKIDRDGNQEWLTATWGDICNMLYSVDEIFDGGFIATGMNASWNETSGYDFYILRTNANGTVKSCPVCTEITEDINKDEINGDMSANLSLDESDTSLTEVGTVTIEEYSGDFKYDICPED